MRKGLENGPEMEIMARAMVGGDRRMVRVRRVTVSCLLSLLAMSMASASSQAKGFMRTRGQDMVDEEGSKVLLKGVGLGNWLLAEGYMWKFGDGGDRPRRIEKLVSDLIGPEKAAAFFDAGAVFSDFLNRRAVSR